MKAKRTKLLFYLLTTVLGLCCMGLQSRLLTEGYDEKGLLVTGSPAFILLWLLTLGFFAAVLALLPKLGDAGTYRKNFPACHFSGSVMMAAGGLMAFSALDELVPGAGMLPFANVAAGAVMALCGVYRIRGRRPAFWLDLAVCLFYGLHLMRCYRGWNASPHIQRYAFPLLAGVMAMLFSLHRARCAGGMMDRKRLVFTGFAGIFLCLVALAGSDSPMFYAASGLWCAGGMCELRRFRRRPRFFTEPVEEQPEPETVLVPESTGEM